MSGDNKKNNMISSNKPYLTGNETKYVEQAVCSYKRSVNEDFVKVDNSKIYFPNLNGLRFIAAFMVIIHHLEQIKAVFGLANYWSNPMVLIIGKLGVVLFFVLSGFLITYLLLAEEAKTKTISIKDFYIRRVFRIWPLYYLIIVLSLFILPKISFFVLPSESFYLFQNNFIYVFILYLLFLPNIVLNQGYVVPYASQSWSVGVEEQFYLIWPVLMKFIKNKQRLLIGVIIVYLGMKFIGFRGIKYILISLNPSIFDAYIKEIFNGVRSFWGSFNIDCMAIGGLFALWLFKKKAILKFLLNKYLGWTIFILLCLLICRGQHIPYVHYEFYALLFAVIILNLSVSKKPIFNLENKYFSYLGKISYGLYMYHVIGIVVSIKILYYLDLNIWLLQLLFATLVTVGISSLSYHFIESKFIKMKLKYSKIISGDNAKK